MIISHKYQYIFIQLEQTASTAIAKELIENYDGEHILWKHATYRDLLAETNYSGKNFFIFAGIRNPLDIVVSGYHRRKIGRDIRHSISNLRMHKFIIIKNAGFQDYFRKFYSKRPYTCWDTKDYDKLDYVYRYENIQEGFSKILMTLGIEQKRSLPLFNVTMGKNADFLSYYTGDIQPIARIIFGRYMRKWGYEFPSNWKEASFIDRLFFEYPLNFVYLIDKIYSITLYDFVTRKVRLRIQLRQQLRGTKQKENIF